MRFLREHQKGKLKCPYRECEKEFDKPIVITDSSSIPRETHYGCPHCKSYLNIETKDSKVIGVNAAEHPNVYDLNDKSTHGQAEMDELKNVEINSNKKSGGTDSDHKRSFRISDHQEIPKEKADHPSESKCSYHFGYLSEKNKNEIIPETCVECPRSIDCMLSEFNKSQQSLEEIKKWYSNK
jgi:hypothetical protein